MRIIPGAFCPPTAGWRFPFGLYAQAMPDRILIVQLNSLADILHTLPAAQSLRRAQPGAHLAWAVDANYAGLLKCQPWLDQVIALNRRGWRGFGRFFHELRRDPWSMAIDFQGRLRSGLVVWLSRAERRIGYLPSLEMSHVFYNERRPLETLNVHAVERNLALVQHVGAALPAVPPSLNPTAEDTAAADAWCAQRRFDPRREQLVVLNPAAARPSHRWPAGKFTQLAKRLLALSGVRVALAGSVGSGALCDQVAGPLGDAIWRADGRFNPVALSVLLARARVVVSGDSGILHLAVASGAHVVGLYGASDKLRSGPYASSGSVLVAGIACSPCYCANCPLHTDPPRCMNEISVDQVFAAVTSRLASHPAPARRSA